MLCSGTLFGWCAPLMMTWTQFLVAWCAAAVLMFGALVWFRQIPAKVGPTGTMFVCLIAWWLMAVIQVVALLARVALFIFDPDGGPISMVVELAKATSRHQSPPQPASPERPAP